MAKTYERYAIHWAPQPDSRLARFGRAWTGRCPETETITASPRDVHPTHRIAQGARCLTFSASIHGPFRLAPGCSQWRLEEALMALSNGLNAAPLDRLRISADGNLVVLRAARSAQIQALCDRVAARVATVSAPSGTGRDDPATPVRIILCRTTSGRAAQAIAAELAAGLRDTLAQPHALSDLALMGQSDANRPWRMLERFELRRETARTVPGFECPIQTMPPLTSVMGSNWDTVIA